MPESSPRLGLPFLQPSQAQKHVTHNEALERLDVAVQLVLVAIEANLPPTDPTIGDTYGLGDAPAGDWAGHGGEIALWDEAGWSFMPAQPGWIAWLSEDDSLIVRTQSGWLPVIPDPTRVDRLGVGGASADAANTVSVAGDASLFSHSGAGHRLTVNKAAESETASLLFQSAWTGHAEMGLAGDTVFAVKVSPNGEDWTEVLRCDPDAQSIDWAPAGTRRMQLRDQSLQIDVPVTGLSVQQDAGDMTPGRLMLAEHGYSPANIVGPVAQTGGAPSGAVIERGVNANGEYVRYADGTQICWQPDGAALSTEAPSGAVYRSSPHATWVFPASFVNMAIFASATVDGDARWAVARVVSNTSLNFRQYQGASSTTALTTRLFAIGRWY
jgi:hypothetical protein